MMETGHTIARLDPADFPKCGNIWDMERQSGLAERVLGELLCACILGWVLRRFFSLARTPGASMRNF